MTDQLRYDGVVDAWKVDLLIRRARRLGLRQHNLQDAVQEIMLDVIAFMYVPEKSNGATEATVLTAIIDNRLSTMLRGTTRYQKHLDGYQKIQTRQYEPDVEFITTADIEAVIESLPEQHQKICRALLAGDSNIKFRRRSVAAGIRYAAPSTKFASASKRVDSIIQTHLRCGGIHERTIPPFRSGDFAAKSSTIARSQPCSASLPELSHAGWNAENSQCPRESLGADYG